MGPRSIAEEPGDDRSNEELHATDRSRVKRRGDFHDLRRSRLRTKHIRDFERYSA